MIITAVVTVVILLEQAFNPVTALVAAVRYAVRQCLPVTPSSVAVAVQEADAQ